VGYDGFTVRIPVRLEQDFECQNILSQDLILRIIAAPPYRKQADVASWSHCFDVKQFVTLQRQWGRLGRVAFEADNSHASSLSVCGYPALEVLLNYAELQRRCSPEFLKVAFVPQQSKARCRRCWLIFKECRVMDLGNRLHTCSLQVHGGCEVTSSAIGEFYGDDLHLVEDLVVPILLLEEPGGMISSTVLEIVVQGWQQVMPSERTSSRSVWTPRQSVAAIRAATFVLDLHKYSFGREGSVIIERTKNMSRFFEVPCLTLLSHAVIRECL